MATSNSKKPAKVKPTKKPAKRKPGPKNVNWLQAKKFYCENNERTYADVAKHFGVTKKSVENRASKESWVSLRQDLGEKAFAKFSETLLDEKSSSQNRHLKLWQELQTTAQLALKDTMRTENQYEDGEIVDTREYIDVKALKDVASVLKTAIDGERTVLGLPTSVNGVSDADGGSMWTGFSDMVKEAERVIAEYEGAEQKQSGGNS